MDRFAPIPPPSTAAVKSTEGLYVKLKTTFPDLAVDFDKKYDAWKEIWFGSNNSPNFATRATGPEFAALVALGPKIVPFVVYRLTSGEDFVAVELYNKVEANIHYKVDPKDILNSKQAAKDVFEFTSERNTAMLEAVKSWADFKTSRRHQNSSFHFTEGDGYWRLTDMGPSIVAPAMLEYFNDQDGWWHELLHQLVHGHTHSSSQATACFFKDTLFFIRNWKEWFEHKDYRDAPYGPDARSREEHPWMVPRLLREIRAIDWAF